MHPIPPHTVQLVLQYIAPLSDPIPPHLISTSLRQRHHFLQISPTSPGDYLCWPSPDDAKIIDILDHLAPLSDHASFPTRYTSDSESTFAHVQISSDAQGLRVLFHWDDIHGWKYHDLRLMPFPSSSYLTPQESLATSFACEVDPLLSPEANRINDDDGGGGDDSYWGTYEAAEHNSILSAPPHNGTDVVEGEDTYWAQYASVQGTADSTVPSPLPNHRKFRPVASTDDELALPSPPQNDPIIDIPADTVAVHSYPLASRPEPPSPNVLAHLLNTISPRKDIYSPGPDDPDSFQSPSAYNTDPSPEQSQQTTADSRLVTPPVPNDYLGPSIVSPAGFELDGVPLSKSRSRLRAEDTAVADSIKGLYYLWKAGRKGEPDEKDKSVFLRIVKAAITCD